MTIEKEENTMGFYGPLSSLEVMNHRMYRRSLAAALAIGFAVGSTDGLDRRTTDGYSVTTWSRAGPTLGCKDLLGKGDKCLFHSLVSFSAGLPYFMAYLEMKLNFLLLHKIVHCLADHLALVG